MIIHGEGYLCVNCYSGDVQQRQEEIRKTGQWASGREEGAGPVFGQQQVVEEPFSFGASTSGSPAVDPRSASDLEEKGMAKEPGSASTDDGFPLAGWIAGMAGLLGFFVRFSIMKSTTVNGETDVFYRDYGAITAGVIAIVFGVIAAVQIMNSRTKKNFGITLVILFLGIIHLIRGFVAF